MAVIKGIYATKTALEEAELESAQDGDTYMVGTYTPYKTYTFKSGSFERGDDMGTKASDLSTPIEIDDITEPVPVAKLYGIDFIGQDNKHLKIRQTLHLGGIQFYVPAE